MSMVVSPRKRQRLIFVTVISPNPELAELTLSLFRLSQLSLPFDKSREFYPKCKLDLEYGYANLQRRL